MRRKMRDSSACLKAHWAQNLSPPISATDIGHNNFQSFTRICHVAILVSRPAIVPATENVHFKEAHLFDAFMHKPP